LTQITNTPKWTLDKDRWWWK